MEKHWIWQAADLNAHPYGEGQGNQHQEKGHADQQPATQANVSVWILQSWGKEDKHMNGKNVTDSNRLRAKINMDWLKYICKKLSK